MKFSLFSVLVLMSGQMALSASAADNKKGIDFFKTDMLSSAKEELADNLKRGDTDQAEACYWLGEVYFALEMPDSAALCYQKGLTADPENLYNRIGQAKLLMKNNSAAAEKAFDEVLKGKNKKDAGLWVAVSRACFAAGNATKAAEYLEGAKEVDKKNPDIYVLEADMMAARQEYGEAGSLYEQAIYFDPACKPAYLKYARIYIDLNPSLALEMLQKLLEQDPADLPARKQLAEIYYKLGQVADAKENYAAYISQGRPSQADRERYAAILFFSGDFVNSLALVRELIAANPSSVVMNRLMMYNLYDLKDFHSGYEAGKTFMALTPRPDYICQDYVYYARLQEKERDKEGAIASYRAAIALDSTKADLYKELGNCYDNCNRYDEAIVNYARFIELGGGKVTPADYFVLGKSHYFAGNALDTAAVNKEARMMHFREADSLFGQVAEKAPDSYLGHFWRARAASSIDADTEQGLAKPYYEQALTLLQKDPVKNARLIIECYSYLGYYHYIKKEMDLSKGYWQKILEIDPANEVARRALDGIK